MLFYLNSCDFACVYRKRKRKKAKLIDTKLRKIMQITYVQTKIKTK